MVRLFLCGILMSAGIMLSAQNYQTIGKKNEPVLDIDVSGEMLASVTLNEAMVWNLKTMSLVYSMEMNNQRLNAVTFGSDSLTVITGSLAGQVTLLNTNSREQIILVESGSQGAVISLDVNIKGDLVAIGFANKKLIVIDLNDKSQKLLYEGYTSDVTAVQFGADGKLLSATGGGEIFEHSADMTETKKIIGDRQWIRALAINPSGDECIFSEDNFSLGLVTLKPNAFVRLETKAARSWITSVDYMSDDPSAVAIATLGGDLVVRTNHGQLRSSFATAINRVKFIPLGGKKIMVAIATNNGLRLVNGMGMKVHNSSW